VFSGIVTSRRITSDGSTFLIDKNGLFVVHENAGWVLKKNFFDEDHGVAKSAILTGDEEITIIGNRYWASSPVAGTEWYLVSQGSTGELLADFTLFLRMIALVVLVMLLAAAAAAVVFSRMITRPFKDLAAVFNVIAGGDLTVSSPDYAVKEAADLSAAFNHFAENIKTLVRAIMGRTEEIAGVGGNLASHMVEAGKMVGEITGNIEEVKGRVINQSASITQTNATMEQISANIEKLNGNAAKQSESVAQSSAAIEQMLTNIRSVTDTLVKNAANVTGLTEAAEAGRSGLTGVATDIQEIAKESEGLLEINAVMQNIASQTNLLSMNAAIEAAHAGEAGKGFAVVADEIRKLAENSSVQSKTIATVLKKIHGSIGKITTSTESVLDKFGAIEENVRIVTVQEENIRSAMEEQGQGSKQILEAIGNLHELSGTVKAGAEEMRRGSKEVMRESRNLEKAAGEITTGMDEMSQEAAHINGSAAAVQELTGRNQESVEALTRAVSKFKVA
jgi:methyl-accepting chemotaxis protein